MNNKKIVIDAGHGGTDSGAVGNGILEKDLNLKISNYIYNRLKQLGLDVKMTRTEDETITPSERVNRVLNAFGNSNNVIVLSNHINAGGGDGAEVIYALRNNNILPNLILSELSNEGQNIRKSYQRRSASDPTKDYYFMQRNTGNTESITIEYGFLDSKGDDVNQLKNNWKNYAEAVVRAVMKYLNLPYIPDSEKSYYTVKAGDTLWSIAKKYNISVSELIEENDLNSSILKIGQVLMLPLKNQLITDDNIYIVQKGDTLYSLAKKFKTTVNNLIELNYLSNNILSIGQKLYVPTENNIYIVKAGDTLYKIAKNNNTTINELIKINNLSNNMLSIGQKIKIKNP